MHGATPRIIAGDIQEAERHKRWAFPHLPRNVLPTLTAATRPYLPANVASFSARFPLSPELWQEWIDDRRAAGGEDALDDVLGLYERAFADYQCAKLWPGYLETLEESLDVSLALSSCVCRASCDFLFFGCTRPLRSPWGRVD